MKYRVIRFFIDRDSLKEFNAGDLFPCDNPERANELINKCYIERIQEEEPAKVDAEDPEPEKELAEDTAPKEEPKKAAKTTKAKGTAKKAATKKKV